MMAVLRSIWVWGAISALAVLWLPLTFVVRLFDRDPVHYRTGIWFRKMGVAMTKVNPGWKLNLSGGENLNPRNPFVIVSNHQSNADIPLLAHLPWEMKWLAKIELFKIPFLGWMMTMTGDIPVDREDKIKAVKSLHKAGWVLDHKCSIMVFPEGTRSTDGRVNSFKDGAFTLAVKKGIPILPVAIDGSFDCLPKHSWIFGPPVTVSMKILDPIETKGMKRDEIPLLREKARNAIIDQIVEWRGVSRTEIDGEATPQL